jgi:hypothetical protein
VTLTIDVTVTGSDGSTASGSVTVDVTEPQPVQTAAAVPAAVPPRRQQRLHP